MVTASQPNFSLPNPAFSVPSQGADFEVSSVNLLKFVPWRPNLREYAKPQGSPAVLKDVDQTNSNIPTSDFSAHWC